jgi:hypothetical protein
MASPRFAGFKTNLENLKAALIVDNGPLGNYTREDHDRALGFRVLASAHLEQFVELRCTEVAADGIERFRTGKPTRTGRALLIWYGTRKKQRWSIPLKDIECVPDSDRLDLALRAYQDSVKFTHGMSGSDFQDLVIPLGLQDGDIDAQLIFRLDALALARQQAAHVAVKRAKAMTDPIQEWHDVDAILGPLELVDAALDKAVGNFS